MSNNIDDNKIISRIDKILKQVDPNSKKQITELSENAEFRKNIEAIKEYLSLSIGNVSISKKLYDKVNYLTNFCNEEYKKLSDDKASLIVKAEENKETSKVLNEVFLFAITKEDFSMYTDELNKRGLSDYIAKLQTIANYDRKSPEYLDAEKSIRSKITNLETN